jgi:hypothetical protein
MALIDWYVLKQFFSFIAGPCALEFTKLKTKDHYWEDTPADELVQRHRISSYISSGPMSAVNRRLGLHVSCTFIIAYKALNYGRKNVKISFFGIY